MNKNNESIFVGVSDKVIRESINQYYYDIVFKDNFKSPIHIILHEYVWYSANSLNLILIFIESILSIKPDTQIYLDLFDNKLIYNILSKSITNIALNSDEYNRILNVKNKIIFYDLTNFTNTLYEYGVNVSPGPHKYVKLRDHIAANQYEKTWRHSSRMLGLNKLIDSELEQRSLSDRISTMANILYKNLYGKLTPEEARKDSEHIMYELVKNIYQHSDKSINKIVKNSGFACAQIIQTPLLNKPKVDSQAINDLVHTQWQNVKKKIQFLSITINDFGIGLANKIRLDLQNRKDTKPLHYQNCLIDEEFINSDKKLMLLAIATDFTTKTYDHDERFLEYRLENKGFGFIFCLSFIAKNLGRMAVRSGSSRLLFIAKPNAYFAECWKNISVAADTLINDFNLYFDVIDVPLTEEETLFPGTQILIEIPVEVFL